MEFKIQGELLQRIVNYLIARPFHEVSKLISDIQEATAPQLPKKEASDEEKEVKEVG
jgi:hypothetical protein